jgi:hypothetical protein
MQKPTREDFIGFPEEVTKLPLYEDEDGEIFGWGHIDENEVIEALKSIAKYSGIEGEFDDVEASDISHTYGKAFLYDSLEDDEWGYVLCPWDDEGAFPVTYVHL